MLETCGQIAEKSNLRERRAYSTTASSFFWFRFKNFAFYLVLEILLKDDDFELQGSLQTVV